MHLAIVERFITQLELNLLRTPKCGDELSKIKRALADLNELSKTGVPESVHERTRQQIELVLESWQANLANRDEKIEAYHIRRHCDGLRMSPKQSVYVALMRFYRDIPPSRQTQSKFDLVLTRCFSSQVSDMFRSMTLSREEVEEKIHALYKSWDQTDYHPVADSAAALKFEEFIEENDALLDFTALTASRLFDRIREYKASLGNLFLEPQVAAAAVECNIVVGNQFNGLMARENESLGERFGTEFDFAGTLQDTSPNAGERVTEALREMDKQEPLLSGKSTDEDLRLILSVIDLSTPGERLESGLPN
ncbi:MAG TPA: hypothetical protein PLK77_14600 [Pyrinomonadaceae bacterium]|nr:hypothetical protein [Pyrinomonadaceae bacterium]